MQQCHYDSRRPRNHCSSYHRSIAVGRVEQCDSDGADWWATYSPSLTKSSPMLMSDIRRDRIPRTRASSAARYDSTHYRVRYEPGWSEGRELVTGDVANEAVTLGADRSCENQIDGCSLLASDRRSVSRRSMSQNFIRFSGTKFQHDSINS